MPEPVAWTDEPYLPRGGYLELRDRPGWGIEINEAAVARDDCVHWERKLPIRPDGSSGYVPDQIRRIGPGYWATRGSDVSRVMPSMRA